MRNTLLSAFIAFVGFAGPLPAAPINPDPAHISINHSGTKIHLSPNEFDNLSPSQDTQNFQRIFNNYPHADIKLDEGTFHISELVEAVGYQGKIHGKGEEKTFIVGRGPFDNRRG